MPIIGLTRGKEGTPPQWDEQDRIDALNEYAVNLYGDYCKEIAVGLAEEYDPEYTDQELWHEWLLDEAEEQDDTDGKNIVRAMQYLIDTREPFTLIKWVTEVNPA
ncbi:TPA: hypothetical protein ACFP4Q_000800 [Neisseria weaveri]